MNSTQNPWNATADFDDALEMFESTEVSPDVALGPIQPGRYKARLVAGALEKSRTGNACFALRWEIADGEHAGRRLVSRHWLTPKAIQRAKAELVALGIFGEHLRGAAPLPDVAAELSVASRADDAGDLYNEVRRVRPVEVKAPPEAGAPVADVTPVDSAGPEAADDAAFLDDEF